MLALWSSNIPAGMMHAFQAEGLAPDIVVFGKGPGGGLPVPAATGPAAVMDVTTAFAIEMTAGNAVSAEVQAGAESGAVLRRAQFERAGDDAAAHPERRRGRPGARHPRPGVRRRRQGWADEATVAAFAGW
jgi:4-aminobutyrate aminotransferase-like enzyme